MAVTINELLEAGVHFGHQTKRWNPKMKPYIYGAKNGIHIFDLGKTLKGLGQACQYLYKEVAGGSKVLFVGTKRQAQDLVRETATRSGMYHITNRWPGGTLTNIVTIRKSVAKLNKYIEMEETGALDAMKKKEASRIRREKEKLELSLGGVREMHDLPDIIVIIDTVKEHLALKEANTLGIPVVAILDSNSDPDLVQVGFPGNDDAVSSLSVLIGALSEATYAGKGIADKNASEAKAKADAERKARREKAEADEGQAEEGEKKPARRPAARRPEAKAEAAEAAEAAPAAEGEKKPVRRSPARKPAAEKTAE